MNGCVSSHLLQVVEDFVELLFVFDDLEVFLGPSLDGAKYKNPLIVFVRLFAFSRLLDLFFVFFQVIISL